MKYLNTAIALLAVATTSAFALDNNTEVAKEAPEVVEVTIDFVTVDEDKSGAISMLEASKYPELMSQFKELDVNKDGELSVEEFSQARF